MRRVLFVLFSYLLGLTAQRGVEFDRDLTWQQVKLKAKAENKYIFMDCYATWCGPCKKMELIDYGGRGSHTGMYKFSTKGPGEGLFRFLDISLYWQIQEDAFQNKYNEAASASASSSLYILANPLRIKSNAPPGRQFG